MMHTILMLLLLARKVKEAERIRPCQVLVLSTPEVCLCDAPHSTEQNLNLPLAVLLELIRVLAGHHVLPHWIQSSSLLIAHHDANVALLFSPLLR